MEMIDLALAQRVIRPRKKDAYKGDMGRVLLIAGNATYGGAAIMSAQAAVHAGAGLVSVATASKNHAPLHARLPEAMVIDWTKISSRTAFTGADVIAIGPGLGTDEAALRVLQETLGAIKKEQVLVLDGSALTLIAQQGIAVSHELTVWTPHAGEWRALSGLSLNEQDFLHNQQAASLFSGIVVAKSARTQIFAGKQGLQNTAGTPALATGGSGDTLVGIIAAFVGQFGFSLETVAAAVYVHSALATELAKTHYVVTPSTLSAELPRFMQKIALQPLL